VSAPATGPGPAANSARERFADAVGWCGTAAILGAFALNSFHVLGPHDARYLLLNLGGAAGVGWVCWRKRAWQAFWLEAVWGLVAAVALVRAVVAG
jgi:hypothetical protein